MSLQDIYKKAGVVMKPAAMKDGKLYSQQPHSGAGDFNFSRADGVQTRINKHGLIETVADNEPRLSYDIVGGKVSDCPHLLLEPSRTNLITYSEDFTNWALGNRITITSHDIVSPDGTQTADKFVETTNNSNHWSENSFSATSGTSYTISMFAKANERTEAVIYGFGDNGVFDYTSAIYDLENGLVISGSGASIENYGNGWYRCIRTMTSGATATGYYAIGISKNQTTQYVGDTSKGLHIWGAQLEAGSYATSYIPTSGSTEQRQSDICNGSGNSETFNDSEGVLFAEISAISDSTFKRISIDSGSYTNSVLFDFDNTNNFYGKVFVGGSAVSTTLVSGLDIDNNNKLALKYKSGDYALWVNGFEFDGGTNTNTPTGLNSLNFELGGFNHFYGNTKQLSTFKKALTDAELEKLTSWESFFDMAKGQEYNVKL